MRPLAFFALAACASPPSPYKDAPPRSATSKAVHEPTSASPPHAIALPGATGPVMLDYLAYDPKQDRVWIPAGGTGRVDVIDAKTEKITAIEGFPTKEVERRGKKHVTGPSAATVGDGVVYIGSRADSSVCAVDAASLEKRDCVTLDSGPDGLQYIADTHEVWVTTPRDKSIRILDVATPGHPTAKDKITFEGEPEGFAVDNAHHVFYTNLEDKDETLAIDTKSHTITAHWQPKCGEDGPKGLALDLVANHLVVVCSDHLVTLDSAHGGAELATLPVGKGLDAIDLAPARHLVAAAAGGAGHIAFVELGADGKLSQVASVPTAKGARNAVVSSTGTAFVAVGPSGSILVVPAPPAEK
jgi:DNA-binding beta-propeller fold protein YncE